MRLVTFDRAGERARVGLLHDADTLIDLAAVGAQAPFDVTDMVALIAAGDAALAWLRGVAAQAPASARIALRDVHLCAPIPRPRKNVFCVGWNYLEHFEEGAQSRTHVTEMPDHPTFFTKAPTAVNGPFDDVPAHAHVTAKLDWEVELGVIVGRAGRDLAEADALRHVFGYTVINDVSAREVQRRHGQQWFKGKSLDGHCPMGPWIVTADEVADPSDLAVVCRVNGVVKQSSNTKHMYFKLPRILAELSAGMTLEPGDIVSTGTPSGVGHARTPPEFMQPGDVLETEVVGLGVLRNRIV